MKQSPGVGAHGASAPAAFQRPSAWLSDRARNALRHPVRIGGVATVVFLVTLLALVIVPRQQRRAADELPAVADRVDTLPLLAHEAGARNRVARAAALLDSQRLALAAADSADSVAAARPRLRSDVPSADSMRALARELTRLLHRAERAPLPSSYRDLASARALAADPRVAPLVDSLVDSLDAIERAQRDYRSVSGIDAGYVSLSARANAVGTRLAALARQRRTELRGEDPSDSLRRRAQLDTLQREADSASHAIVMARATNARVAAMVAAARERANIDAPPTAMLAAALALALALGGAASLAAEIFHPRVASARDAEEVAKAPVVGVLDEEPASVDRLARRIGGDTGGRTRIAICAMDARVCASVAAAIATASAAAGRAVLVVDTDTATTAASHVLRRHPSPGSSDVIARGATWASVLDAHVGSHSLPLDFVPAGAPIVRAPDTVTVEDAGRMLGDLTLSYDLSIVCVSPVDRPIVDVLLASAGVRDAYLCAEPGETPLAVLRRERDRWAAAGAPLCGVIFTPPSAAGGQAALRQSAGR